MAELDPDCEHKILQGQGAGKWLPFARRKVAALYDRAHEMRVTALVQRWRLEGGMVEIAVRVVDDQRYIHIRRKTCPPFLSGFTDFVYHTFPGSFDPVYQVPDPNDASKTINVFRRFYPSPAQTEPPRAWRDEPGLAVNAAAAIQLGTLQSSMFSGEMRKVVQVLQGMNVEIPYSPYFHPTHGVFKAGNGSRWIIEISNQGCVAWPMRTCHATVHDRDDEPLLDYQPIATPKPADEDIPAAIAAGTFVVLIDHTTIQEFYNKGPMFTHCGWAFSDDGHKAANVANWKLGGFLPTETFLYEITISEVDNRPSTGSLALIATGIYHGDRVYAQVKFPRPIGSLFSFDPFEGVFSGALSDAPIYTYYEDAQRIDVYYVNDPTTGTSTGFSEPRYNACGHVNFSSMGVEIRVSGSESSYPTPTFRITGLGSLPATILSNSITYSKKTLGEHLGQNLNTLKTNIYAVYAMTNDDGAYVALERDFYAFVVPYGEREAYYLARKHERNKTYSSRVISNSMVTYGVRYGVVITCACGGGGSGGSSAKVINDQGGIVSSGAFCGSELEIELLGVSAMPSPSCHIGSGGSGISGVQILYQASDAPAGACGERGTVAGTCPDKIDAYTCFCSGGASDCNSVSFAGHVESNNSFSVEFHGSGSVERVFSPIKQDPWFSFLESDQVQYVVAYRDAFVPGKMIISPEIDTFLGSDLYSAATDYPVSEAGRYFNFIGVS